MEAAWAASKTRTFLGSKFWALAGRSRSQTGKKKAAVAIAHKILVIAYHVLKNGEPYNELGHDFLKKRRSISAEESMIRRLNKLGYTVTNNKESIA